MKRWVLTVLGVVFLLGAMAAGIGLWLVHDYATTPNTGAAETFAVDIPSGAGPLTAAQVLAEHGVIDDPVAFARWVRYIERAAGKLKAGELAFRGNMTPEQVLRVLIEGTPITHRISLPEGLRIDEVAGLLAEAGLANADSLEARARDPEFTASLGLPGTSLEGFLFPDTYLFSKHTPLDTILQALVEKYQKTFTDEWRKRAKRYRMTELQVVTLASIVEKETGAEKERPLIAGVFHNRLRQDWKLQTDPTVIYAEILDTGKFDGTIHRSDLNREHPYNTYRRKGLPPGPICSPGAASIKAVLFPERTQHMYFVSKNDGTHAFCPDLACHNRAVAQFRR